MRLQRIVLAAWMVLWSASTQAAVPAAPRISESDARYEEIYLKFDQAMLTWNDTSDSAAIRIEPAVPCSWYWDDDTSLACRMRQRGDRLQPASSYRVSIGQGLWSQAGVEAAPVQLVLETSRPEISLETPRWQSGFPEMQLSSSQGIDVLSLTQVLSVDLDGAPLRFRIRPEDPENIRNRYHGHAFTLELVDRPSRAGLLQVRIQPGLRSKDGPLPGEQKEVLLQARVNEPFHLRAVSCAEHEYDTDTTVGAISGQALSLACTPEKMLRLYFSRPLSPASLAAFKAALPEGLQYVDQVDDVYNAWRTKRDDFSWSPASVVNLRSSVAARTLAIELATTLVAEDGASLAEPVRIAASIGDFQPDTQVTPAVSLITPGSDAKPVLQMRNVEAEPRLVQLSIADDVRLSTQRLSVRGPRNRWNDVTVPEPPEAVRDSGGLVLSGARNNAKLGFAEAYAPFNVLVSNGASEAVVWVTAWKGGGNLDGADVELLQVDLTGKQHVLGRARTGPDGVALLPLPKLLRKLADSSQLPMLVRVTHQGLRTITPAFRYQYKLALPDGGRENSGSDSAIGEGDQSDFGVSDRPLYRPGETVDYRVWLREREGNHLVHHPDGKPVELTLFQLYGKSYQSWTAMPDELGSVIGKLRLPSMLPDDFYCIGLKNGDHNWNDAGGACFQVARFEAQALWVKTSADRAAVLAGGEVALQIDSGYFSGDAAAGVGLEWHGLLTPRRIEDTYPEFSDFTFLASGNDREGSGGLNPLYGLTLPTRTDSTGHGRYLLHLLPRYQYGDEADDVIAFGLMEFSGGVNVAGKASANSAPAPVHYSQYPAYVGLKTQQWWLPIDRDPILEAVLVGYDGKRVVGRAIDVSIEAVGDSHDKAATVLAHCQLQPGQASPCPFRAPRAGSYRLRASAEGMAPVTIDRYFGNAAPNDAVKKTSLASITLLRASNGLLPARVKLHQPYARANVLFTVEYQNVLSHWVQSVTETDQEIDVPVQADWAPGVSLRALIRDSGPAADAQPLAPTESAVIDLDIPKLSKDAITVAFDRSRTEPGQDVVLRLSNTTTRARHATVSLVDDSIYQQAPEVQQFSDPNGDRWLGGLAFWEDSDWYGLEGFKSFGNPFYQAPRKRWTPRTQRPIQFEAPSAVTASSDTKSLEKVEVTGSRIDARTIFARSAAMTALTRSTQPRPGQALARVRSSFADTAYWNPDLTLAPGETRELPIHLPDNLTRWRLRVWTSDSADGFALMQTTLETGLALELRAGVPSQVYVGDHATGNLSARNHGNQAAQVTISSEISGSGVSERKEQQGTVAGNAELSQRIAFSPTQTGDLQVLARAGKSGAADAVSASVPVLSREGSQQQVQAGWIAQERLILPLPTLPAGATSPVLDVQVNRGFEGWSDGWLRDLRDYPHRCWEQTLSRAVGAALAIDSGRDKSLWPQARDEVEQALNVAPAFQDDEGSFRFFLPGNSYWYGAANPVLSSYTLRSFTLLQSLGFKTPESVQEPLVQAVTNTAAAVSKSIKPADDNDWRWENAAIAAGALTDPKQLDTAALTALWQAWPRLSWFARSELVRALTLKPGFSAQAREGVQRLRDAGEIHGLRRVIRDSRDFNYVLGSSLRDQCGVVGALFELDHGEDGAAARMGLLRGLQDLFAGGTESLDTQAEAQCLMALHAAARNLPAASGSQQVSLALGSASTSLSLSAGKNQARWTPALPTSGGREALIVQGAAGMDPTLNFTAALNYRIDMQLAPALAVGMRLQRDYQVLRNGHWIDLEQTRLREGDWVRVRLRLDVPSMRHYVAITDIVPGGLVSRDITLSGVGGIDLKNVGDAGSWWFDSRQTGANKVQLYAEQLPPGEHEVYYFAQAVQPGDYLAPPAVAELMYGRASRASTQASRLSIDASPAAGKP